MIELTHIEKTFEQPGGDQLQQQVALVVPERIVERLEVVEIDEEQRAAPAGAQARRERLVQSIE